VVWIRGGAQKVGLPIVLKPDEVEVLLASPTSLRDRIILRLLYYCALRVSEALGLRLEDINLQDRIIKVCHALTSSGLPKEYKERLVPVDPETLRLIVEYAGPRREGRLFQIKIRHVQRLVKLYARQAGIQSWMKVTPHKLRHSFAVHWIARGGDIERLRRILGHSSLDMTQIYLQFSLKDVQEEYDRIMSSHAKDGGEQIGIRAVYESVCRIEKRLDHLTRSLKVVA